MDQVFQVVGAILVLAAFIASQRGWMVATSRTYLVLNVLGAGVLTVVAALDRDWGFLLLEGVWTLVALLGLLRRPVAAH